MGVYGHQAVYVGYTMPAVGTQQLWAGKLKASGLKAVFALMGPVKNKICIKGSL